MSRLNSLSAAALKAMYSQESTDALIMLLTISSPSGSYQPIRLADGFTGRLTAYTTDTEVVYGVTSRGNNYIFLPMTIQLPEEQDIGVGTCNVVFNYVTQEAIVLIRQQLTEPADVTIELVLSSSPSTVEAVFTGFAIVGATYNADQITLDMSMVSLTREPFPCFNFTPANFPGIF